MLRKYLDDLRMEQLVVPVLMVSVDLIDGVALVRDRGDVSHNILESINLPAVAADRPTRAGPSWTAA